MQTATILTEGLGWFGEAQEAARFALGYSVREERRAGSDGWLSTPVGRPDGFDPTGEIRSLLRAMYPESMNNAPVRLMEHLIDEGLRRIAVRIDEGATSVGLLGLTRRRVGTDDAGYWLAEPRKQSPQRRRNLDVSTDLVVLTAWRRGSAGRRQRSCGGPDPLPPIGRRPRFSVPCFGPEGHLISQLVCRLDKQRSPVAAKLLP